MKYTTNKGSKKEQLCEINFKKDFKYRNVGPLKSMIMHINILVSPFNLNY